MRVTVLGSGDAFNSGGRRHSAYLVESEGTTFLLDCGTTTLLALKTLGISPNRIDFAAISHLHGDHFAGLPFLFLEFQYESTRSRPFTILGPPGTESRVLTLFETMYRGISKREHKFDIRFEELASGQATTFGKANILPFKVPHQEFDIAFGYRADVSGKTILYSGDCGWNEALVHHSEGADLFICECCYYETRTSFHVSYPIIASERSRLRCKRLLLSHLGREVLERLDEVTIEYASDGMVLDI